MWTQWINHRSKNNLQEVLEINGETSQIESSYTSTTLDNPLIKPITEQPTNPTTDTYSPPSNEPTEKEKKAKEKEKKEKKAEEESPFSPFFSFWGH